MKFLCEISVLICICLSYGDAGPDRSQSVFVVDRDAGDAATVRSHTDAIDKVKNLKKREAANPEAKIILQPSPSNSRELTVRVIVLTEVSRDMFSGVSNLTKLEIAWNSLKVIRANAFSDMKNLSSLSLMKNDINTLETGCFNGLDRLTSLDLSYNKLTLTPGIFDSLTRLEKLNLEHSVQPGGFPISVLRSLPALTILKIPHVGLETLEPGMFDANPNLRELHLGGNPIRHIPKNVFNSLKELKSLVLWCDIKSIEAGAFSGLNIDNLNLSGGYSGKIIDTGAFSGLTVGYFHLGWNKIEEIRPRAFYRFKAGTLSLTYNRITTISAKAFLSAEIGKLEILRNQIKKIEPNTFRYCKIGKINFWNNPIYNEDWRKLGIPDSTEIIRW